MAIKTHADEGIMGGGVKWETADFDPEQHKPSYSLVGDALKGVGDQYKAQQGAQANQRKENLTAELSKASQNKAVNPSAGSNFDSGKARLGQAPEFTDTTPPAIE